MKKKAYSELATLETTFWWHVGRMNIIDKQLGELPGKKTRKILNIGAGTGGTIPTLEKHGSVTNVDTSDDAIALLKKSGYEVKKISGGKLPFKDNEFDVITALDVLEHIDDDAGAIKEWQRVIKPGGHMIITVPAYQWLWSEHDETNMHYRRYTRKSLHKAVHGSENLNKRKLSYMIVFSLPLIAGFRMIERLKPKKTLKKSTNFVILPKPINNFFIQLLKIEGSAHKFISFPTGTSLISVSQKAKK